MRVMVLVTFSADTVCSVPGILREGSIIAVEDLPEREDATTAIDCLPDLSELERSASKMIDGGVGGVDVYTEDEATFQTPLRPPKIIRVEGCYEHDLIESDYNQFVDAADVRSQEWPRIWAAPQSAIVEPGDKIVLPQYADQVRPGVELAIVIGSQTKNYDPSTGSNPIAGYLVMADIGIFDELPGQWGYKFFDSALPVGRGVVPRNSIETDDLELTVSIDGEKLDSRSTADRRFTPIELISSISTGLTLHPGDLILTGDPMRVEQKLRDGDTLRVSIETVGSIETTVIRETADARIRI
jgi:2-keto-4-pentenoate hydratase/2-oxohepta-3-ene-1,7-dioic acid hydratase in catechol pathway